MPADLALAADELTRPSASERVFRETARAGLADVAPSGRVRLDALACWLQDVAYADVEEAGLAESARWVLRRSRVCVRRFPRHAERVELATWCSGLGRLCAERRTTLEVAGVPVAEALTLWVHLDPVSLRPAPFSRRELETYGGGTDRPTVKGRLRHRSPDDAEVAGRWRFVAADVDLLGHVNNAAYWRVLEERLLAGPEPSAVDAEVEYRSPAEPGDHTVLSDGRRLWLAARDGTVCASLDVALRC